MLPSKCGEFSPAFPLERGCFLRTPAGKAADAKEETNCVELGLRVHAAAIRLCVRRARWLPRANRSGENSPNLIDLERQNLDVLVSAMASGTLLASVRIAVQFIAKLLFRWFSGIALLSKGYDGGRHEFKGKRHQSGFNRQ